VLAQRLRDALARLNPALPAEALDAAFRKLTRPEGADLIVRNRALHRLFVDGVTVEYRNADGSIRGAQARVIDFDDPAGNDWLAVNQFSVVENAVSAQAHVSETNVERAGASGRSQNKHSRRPDVVLFVNGLPLAVLELKNAAAESATIWSAFQQLQTYRAEVPVLFAPNALLAVSDGVEARVGTLGAGREWFKPWRTVAGERLAGAHVPELQVVIEGLCAPRRLLDLLGDFIVFEDDGGRIIREPAMGNPTLVVLSDRNDLDDQLFATFARCRDLLRQPPVQAESRAHLRELLGVAAGGVVFATLHKFFPEQPSPQPSPGERGKNGDALRPPQHRGDRRRGASQPIRLHRRLCAPYARCAAARLVHRLHGHADRAAGRQHARGVRRQRSCGGCSLGRSPS
jgi:type I site-specific restriction-modification system R (restriction) subunit